MKKVMCIITGVIVALIVLGIMLEHATYLKMGSLLGEYDREVEQQIAAEDYEAAYLQLNHLHNRLATFGGGLRILNAGHLNWIGYRLEARRAELLPRLADAFPDGMTGDWSTVEELEQRYIRFHGERIAMRIRDKNRRRMIELGIKFRDADRDQPVGLLPERVRNAARMTGSTPSPWGQVEISHPDSLEIATESYPRSDAVAQTLR